MELWLIIGLYPLLAGLYGYVIVSHRPTRAAHPGEPRQQSLAGTVRDSLAAALRPKRPYVVADDLHQARAERQAHQDGAGLKPPPRYG